jgi:undecaprenyl pyrophosphate phosphatase UppP
MAKVDKGVVRRWLGTRVTSYKLGRKDAELTRVDIMIGLPMLLVAIGSAVLGLLIKDWGTLYFLSLVLTIIFAVIYVGASIWTTEKNDNCTNGS